MMDIACHNPTYFPLDPLYICVGVDVYDISLEGCRRTCLSENHYKPQILEDVTFLPE